MSYKELKEKVRDEAIEFSYSQESMSWGEYASITNRFEKLAKRYGLVREFRENGII